MGWKLDMNWAERPGTVWVVRWAIKQRGRVWEGERGAGRQPPLEGVTFHKCSALSEEGAGQRLTQTSRFFATTHSQSPSRAQPDLAARFTLSFVVKIYWWLTWSQITIVFYRFELYKCSYQSSSVWAHGQLSCLCLGEDFGQSDDRQV